MLENLKADPAEFVMVVTKAVVAVENDKVGATALIDPRVGIAKVFKLVVVRRVVSFVPPADVGLGFTNVIDDWKKEPRPLVVKQDTTVIDVDEVELFSSDFDDLSVTARRVLSFVLNGLSVVENSVVWPSDFDILSVSDESVFIPSVFDELSATAGMGVFSLVFDSSSVFVGVVAFAKGAVERLAALELTVSEDPDWKGVLDLEIESNRDVGAEALFAEGVGWELDPVPVVPAFP